MTSTIIIAIFGFAGILTGIVSLRANYLKSKIARSSISSRRWFWAAILIGVASGIASWPLTYWMGYSIHIESEVGRVVGFPFFVAYFDSAGRDYVGPLTLPGVIANGLFWFLIPQLALHLYNLRPHFSSSRL